MKSQINQALTAEVPTRRPRTIAEQRMRWRQKLQEELECEKQDIHLLKRDTELMAFWEETITRHNDWKHSLNQHVSFIDFTFYSMHRVAIFDDLLGGTGISKDAGQESETNQMQT